MPKKSGGTKFKERKDLVCFLNWDVLVGLGNLEIDSFLKKLDILDILFVILNIKLYNM